MGERGKSRRFPVADIVGYSRLASADEDRIYRWLRSLRIVLIDLCRRVTAAGG